MPSVFSITQAEPNGISQKACFTVTAESFEADLTDVSFQIPELSAEDTLELWLEATLSDGSITDTCGAGWFMENGRLMLVAG